jgi:hypothetical protein
VLAPVDTPTTLWHGGVPDLKPGDMIVPAPRQPVDNCPMCQAMERGESVMVRHQGQTHFVDGPREITDGVYVTSDRFYASHYASRFGRGDLYRVEPVGQIIAQQVEAGGFPVWVVPQARVVSVVQRMIVWTDKERRRFIRLTADRPMTPFEVDRELRRIRAAAAAAMRQG